MAYSSTRNYAQEIQDIIKKGGDANQVQQLLNERLEKQQSMDTGYSTYDDVYRQAMDYIAGAGVKPVASATVDYAAIANQILADQKNRNVSDGDLSDRSWADLGTVLDARENKLGTGKYNEWANSIAQDVGMAYNGEDSIYEYLKAETATDDLIRQWAAAMLAGSGSNGGYTGGGYVGGSVGGSSAGTQPVKTQSGSQGAVQRSTGVTGTVSATRNAGSLGVSKDSWEQQQLRDMARDLVEETHAATRVPVQGEMSSYVEANTDRAYDAAAQVLLAENDRAGAQAIRDSQKDYEARGKVDVRMPAVTGGSVGSGGKYLGGTRPSSGGTVELVAENPLYPGVPQVQTGGGTVSAGDRAAGNGNVTDAAIDAYLAELGYVPSGFSFATTVFDNNSLNAQRGDLTPAKASGSGYTPAKITVTPSVNARNVPEPATTEDAYRAAIQDAIQRGDNQSAVQLNAALSDYMVASGQRVPENQQKRYTVESSAGGSKQTVSTEELENLLDSNRVQIVVEDDGSFHYILKDRFGR